MSEDVQAIKFDIEDIGKHVKSSKKRFSWIFGLNNRQHTIVLDFSFISGKVKLSVDRKIMLETELPANSSFQHPFTLDGYAVNILQQGESFELRINNKVFSHLYNQAKTNTQFRNYEDEVKDIKVNESNFQNTGKTVKLNIGAFEGTKKKTKTTNESENWGNFGGQSAIPSYFGDSQSSTQSEKPESKKKSSLLDSDEQQQHARQKTQQTHSGKTEEVDFFANNNTQPDVSTSPSQQHLQSIKNQPKQQQFNTMQNMFATINIQGTQQTQQPQQQNMSGLDLLNSTTNNQSSEFSTMQNLFATQAPGQGMNLGQGLPQQQTSNTGNVNISDYNTMQNLFATGMPNQNIGNIGNIGGFSTNSQSNPVPTMPSPTEFNTMQNLFQTGYQGAPVTSIQGLTMNTNTTPSVPNTSSFQTGTQNFNTMQNLFATQAQGQGISIAQLQSNPNTSNPQTSGPGITDFNTMQNLFATQANGGQLPTNFGTQQNQQNLQNVNIQDFNTMQNLFKTGTGIQLPPPGSQGQKDPFALLSNSEAQKATSNTTQLPQVPNAGMFKTYSGPVSSGQNIDVSNFGTMQKGQLPNVNFFQQPPVTPVQPTQEVPNFSKKKAAQETDLI